MANAKTVRQIKTPEFRVSYPNIFEPKALQPGQDPKYSLVMLFDKSTDISALKQMAMEAAKEKFPNGLPAGFRNPFRDGDVEKPGVDGYEGVVFANAKSSDKYKPGLVDQNVNPITDRQDFYAGCYAHATIRVYAYDHMGNRGVGFGLVNIQKLRDGENLGGGGSSPQSDFEVVEVARTEADMDFDFGESAAQVGTQVESDPFEM